MYTFDQLHKMTKQQVIKKLKELGVTNINPDGKYCITCNIPGYNKIALVDPRDLLEELSSKREA